MDKEIEELKNKLNELREMLMDSLPFSRDYIEGYINGSENTIKYAWHNKTTMPDGTSLMLMYTDYGYKLGYDLIPEATSWAYVKDLTPNK